MIFGARSRPEAPAPVAELPVEVTMIELASLWMPILVSAVLVFVVSSVIHMAPLWHKDDYPRVPQEDRVMEALRPLAIQPGDYMVPRASGAAEMKSPEFAAKAAQGPVLIMSVLPNGMIGMGASLAQWFVYAVVVSLFAGYVASRALGPAADYLDVFRFAGTTAFACYALGLWQMSIWYKRAWSLTVKATADGLIYALVTAGTFGWLWPS
jgi:hypothetical protein